MQNKADEELDGKPRGASRGAYPRSEGRTQAQAPSPNRFRRLRGPALAAGGFALISPLGLGFAAAVTAVAAGMFLMSRRSARRELADPSSTPEKKSE